MSTSSAMVGASRLRCVFLDLVYFLIVCGEMRVCGMRVQTELQNRFGSPWLSRKGQCGLECDIG
jgi:hypothetical protein